MPMRNPLSHQSPFPTAEFYPISGNLCVTRPITTRKQATTATIDRDVHQSAHPTAQGTIEEEHVAEHTGTAPRRTRASTDAHRSRGTSRRRVGEVTPPWAPLLGVGFVAAMIPYLARIGLGTEESIPLLARNGMDLIVLALTLTATIGLLLSNGTLARHQHIVALAGATAMALGSLVAVTAGVYHAGPAYVYLVGMIAVGVGLAALLCSWAIFYAGISTVFVRKGTLYSAVLALVLTPTFYVAQVLTMVVVLVLPFASFACLLACHRNRSAFSVSCKQVRRRPVRPSMPALLGLMALAMSLGFELFSLLAVSLAQPQGWEPEWWDFTLPLLAQLLSVILYAVLVIAHRDTGYATPLRTSATLALIAFPITLIAGFNPIDSLVATTGTLLLATSAWFFGLIVWTLTIHLANYGNANPARIVFATCSLTGASLLLGMLLNDGNVLAGTRITTSLAVLQVLIAFALALTALNLLTPRVLHGQFWAGIDTSGLRDSDLEPLQRFCSAVAEGSDLSLVDARVLFLLASGHSIDYIRESLGLSSHVYRSTIERIYLHFDVHSRQELLTVLDGRRAQGAFVERRAT